MSVCFPAAQQITDKVEKNAKISQSQKEKPIVKRAHFAEPLQSNEIGEILCKPFVVDSTISSFVSKNFLITIIQQLKPKTVTILKQEK